MKSNPKNFNFISVILATYNGEEYLSEQLDSILNQTYGELELLIQDDCSTDGTWDILQKYAKQDSRIQLFKNAANKGIAANFLSLIKKTSGAFIAISDQDDIWELTKLEKLYQNIGNYSLIYSDSVLIDRKGRALGMTLLEKLKQRPKEGDHLIGVFEHNTISGHSCMFSKELKKNITESSKFWTSDIFVYDMVLGFIASSANGVTFYSESLTKHRLHPNNNQNKGLGANTPVKQKLSFWTSKVQRVCKKIFLQREVLLFLESYRANLASSFSNALELRPSRHFPRLIFNFRFFYYLNKTDLSFSKKTKLSFGKWYYILFKWM